MSRLPQIDIKTTSTKAATDLVFVLQDGSKKVLPPKGPYASVVQKALKVTHFQGKSASVQYLPLSGKGSTQHVLLVGCGSVSEVTPEKMRVAGAHALSKLAAEKVANSGDNFHFPCLKQLI